MDHHWCDSAAAWETMADDMKLSWRFTLSLVFAWILWELVASLTKQSEQWINQTSYPSQQVCLRDGLRMIDERRDHYLRRGLGAAYIFNEGIDGFSVGDKEKHIFMCYSSDFHPDRDRNFGLPSKFYRVI